MSLTTLLENGAPRAAVAHYLDSISHDQRLADMYALKDSDQRQLYDQSVMAPLDLAHFVPPSAGPLTEVIHYGRNTVPVPDTIRHFQKRFCQPADGRPQLFGYNEGFTRNVLGPGFFVVDPVESEETARARGPVVIDYLRIPDAAVVPGWPKIVPNERGLQRFVYSGTQDFMRKVSEHMSVGAAFKGSKRMGFYFMLLREP